jgi:hypothetical protein
MKTVDNLINDLKIFGFDNLDKNIPVRDIKILKNISNLMTKSQYITENQGNLLLKILRENTEWFGSFRQDVIDVLENPAWLTTFRFTEKVKKVYLGINKNNEKSINLEATFDKNVKKVLSVLNKSVGYDYYENDTKIYSYLFNEKNIVTIFKTLKPYKFQFSEDFLDLYNKINQIESESVFDKFDFYNFYDKFLKHKNIEIDTKNPLDILDKKIRYQYRFNHNFEESKKSTLEYKIADRNQSKIYINKLTNLSDLFESLHILNRKKILVIFDEFHVSETLHNLKMLNSYSDSLSYKKNIGVYFRFDGKDYGKEFNQIVSDKKLNVRLDDDTDIVVVSNGKIPKFILKHTWYPDAVISFTNSLRNNKTDVYCSKCDLVVYYLDSKPLSIKTDEIL